MPLNNTVRDAVKFLNEELNYSNPIHNRYRNPLQRQEKYGKRTVEKILQRYTRHYCRGRTGTIK